MAKIDFPESWAGVAEPLRALIAEVARETHGATPPDLATVSARWAQVRHAVHSAVRARASCRGAAGPRPVIAEYATSKRRVDSPSVVIARAMRRAHAAATVGP